jgi:hypothetical protein
MLMHAPKIDWAESTSRTGAISSGNDNVAPTAVAAFRRKTVASCIMLVAANQTPAASKIFQRLPFASAVDSSNAGLSPCRRMRLAAGASIMIGTIANAGISRSSIDRPTTRPIATAQKNHCRKMIDCTAQCRQDSNRSSCDGVRGLFSDGSHQQETGQQVIYREVDDQMRPEEPRRRHWRLQEKLQPKRCDEPEHQPWRCGDNDRDHHKRSDVFESQRPRMLNDANEAELCWVHVPRKVATIRPQHLLPQPLQEDTNRAARAHFDDMHGQGGVAVHHQAEARVLHHHAEQHGGGVVRVLDREAGAHDG